MLAPAMGYSARASTGDGFGGGVLKRPGCFLLLALLAAPPTCPATATTIFEPYTLRVKTCNRTRAGTTGKLLLSFCEGYNSCTTGPANEYNSEAQLNVLGAWNTLEVPLEYEPTTMSMTIVGTDAWCVEEVVWDGQGNMLGTGGSLYLDGDRGDMGCEYGVHFNTGRYYPCQSNWRFFNLPDSDEYRYEIKVRPCTGSTSITADPALTSSPRIASSLCSESQCDPTVGEVIDLNLSVTAAVGGSNSGWATTLVPAGFNPVAMTLTNMGEFPWCAEAITFNDYTLINESVSPRGLKLGVGDVRRFFNVQALGIAAVASSELYGGSADDGLEDQAWGLAFEVIEGVLVVTATVAFTAFVRRCVIKNRGTNRHDEEGLDSSDDDVGKEADDAPLCRTCHYVDHSSGSRGRSPVAATAMAENASKKKGDDGAGRRCGNNESDTLFCQRHQLEPTRPSCSDDGHDQRSRSRSCSSRSSSSVVMPSSRASSKETMVVAYHHPWKLEPA